MVCAENRKIAFFGKTDHCLRLLPHVVPLVRGPPEGVVDGGYLASPSSASRPRRSRPHHGLLHWVEAAFGDSVPLRGNWPGEGRPSSTSTSSRSPRPRPLSRNRWWRGAALLQNLDLWRFGAEAARGEVALREGGRGGRTVSLRRRTIAPGPWKEATRV